MDLYSLCPAFQPSNLTELLFARAAKQLAALEALVIRSIRHVAGKGVRTDRAFVLTILLVAVASV